MYSIIYLLLFIPTFWFGLNLFVRKADDHRIRLLIPALLSAAAAQLCALIALTINSESVAVFWRRGILLSELVFLLSYVIFSFALFSKKKQRHRSSTMQFSTKIATMSVLGLAGVVPLFPLVGSEFAGVLVEPLLLLAVVALGSGIFYLHSLRVQFSWNELLRLVGHALWLTLYATVSLILMWWLVKNHISDSPFLIAFALSFLGIGVLEVIYLRLSGYLSKLFPKDNLDYYQMSKIIHKALVEQNLSQMMQVVLNRLCQRLKVSKGFIAIREDQGDFKVRVIYGMVSIRIGESIELPITIDPLFLPNSGRSFNLDLIEKEMALLIPLKVKSKQYGLLALGHQQIRDFDNAEIQLIATLGDELAIAIENLQLKHEISEQLTILATKSDDFLGRQTVLRESLSSTLIGLKAVHQQRLKVQVYCLGRFEVYLGQRTIKDTEWGRRSSGPRYVKALFAYLVANQERPVRRDELIEVIWGDSADVSILKNRLDRTMSALRRALEPTLRKGGESSYIITSLEGYRLNPVAQWWVDDVEFSRLFRKAEVLERTGEEKDALIKYQEAEKFYQGDYMIDCAFIDRSHLITQKREALRQQYFDVLIRIARLYQRNDSHEIATSYLQKVALEDEFNEEVYRALVRSYCTTHRYAEAVEVCNTHSSILARAELPCSGTCFPPEVREMLAEHLPPT